MKLFEYERAGDAGSAPMEIDFQLFQIPHTGILALGPPACLRLLYFRAMEKKALHKLRLCPVGKTDYVFGSHGSKMGKVLEGMLAEPWYQAVIIYVACPDIIAQTDFPTLLKGIHNPEKVPIFIHRRGPLERRRGSSGAHLFEIEKSLEPMSEEDGSVHPPRCGLPPLASDYAGALNTFMHGDIEKLLLTVGGCSNCPRSVDALGIPTFSYLRQNDVTAALYMQDGVQQAVEAMAVDKKQCLVMGTPVSRMLGVEATDADGVTFVKTDGFGHALSGEQHLISTLAKKMFKKKPKVINRLNILGWSPFTLGNIKEWGFALKCLEEGGIHAVPLGHSTLVDFMEAPAAAVNWVVSTEAQELADWLEDQYGIPQFSGFPFGRRQTEEWVKRIVSYFECSEGTFDALFTGYNQTPVARNIIIAQTEGSPMAQLLWEYLNRDRQVSGHIFSTSEILRLDADKVDALIADPLYRTLLNPALESKLVEWPYPALSGNRYLNLIQGAEDLEKSFLWT